MNAPIFGGGSSPTPGGPAGARCQHCDGQGLTPSPVYYPRLGFSEMAFCLCPAGRDCFRAWASAPEQRRYARLVRLRAGQHALMASELPPRFHGSELEDLSIELYLRAECTRYVGGWPEHRHTGMGLHLFGRVGSGKTTIAATIASMVVRRHLAPTLFVSLPEVSRQLHEDRTEGDGKASVALWRRMAQVDLLVLEDLDRAVPSASLKDRLYRLVDERWGARRPMIVTASCPLENLARLYDAPLLSRLRQRCGQLEVTGYDRRTPPSGSPPQGV